MIFSRLYGAKSMLWERFMKGPATPLRAELRQQYEQGPEGFGDLASIGQEAIKPEKFYRLRGGAKAYVIGRMHPSVRAPYWIGYIVDQRHGIYHEFNDWWPDGSNCSGGQMRAFDIVAPWPDAEVCQCCGQEVRKA